MSLTPFPVKATREKLYAHEINAIHSAINNLEAALGLISPGSASLSIPPSQLAPGIDASLLSPASSASLASLSLSASLTVGGDVVAKGEVSFEDDGRLIVYSQEQGPSLVIGSYQQGSSGIRAFDGSRITLLVDEAGSLTARGHIESDETSILQGELQTKNGSIQGDVTLGLPGGILLEGDSRRLVVGPQGQIKAGANTIAHQGIEILSGNINLGYGKTWFYAQDSGKLTARGADLEGKFEGIVESDEGSLGGIDITESGLSAGGDGPDTQGFSLDKSGAVYITQGAFKGNVDIQAGKVSGNLQIQGNITANGVTIGQSGITITHGSISLGGGAFQATSQGKLTASDAAITGHINATSGTFLGDVTAGSVTLSSRGVEVFSGGVRILGEDGLVVEDGSVVLKSGSRSFARLGLLEDQSKGIEILDPSGDAIFSAKDDGSLTIKGTLYGTDGTFSGRIEADDGFFGNVEVTGDVSVTTGKIQAGQSVIDSSGLHLAQGTINLSDRFMVDEDGYLVAEDAHIKGRIDAEEGRFSGEVQVGLPTQFDHTITTQEGWLTGTFNGTFPKDGELRLVLSGDLWSVEMGNPAAFNASEGYVAYGTYESDVFFLDALTADELMAVISWEATIPSGTSVRVYWRTIEDDGENIGWSSWEQIFEPGDAAGPINQQLQLKVELETGNPDYTPWVHSLSIYARGQGVLIDGIAGRIVAGLSELNRHGIHIREGTIQLGRFSMSSEGIIHARDGIFEGTVYADSGTFSGRIEATDGFFGTGEGRIHIGPEGIASGELGDESSPFGIYTTGSQAGDAYFKGRVSVGQHSVVEGDLSVSTGRIYAGHPSLARVEIAAPSAQSGGGLFVYKEGLDEQGSPIAIETARIEADTGLLIVSEGQIAGWDISPDAIHKKSLFLESSGRVRAEQNGADTAILGEYEPGQWGLWAIQGKIGGWHLSQGSLAAGSVELQSSGKVQVKSAPLTTEVVLGEYEQGKYGLKAGPVTLDGEGLKGPSFFLGEQQSTIGGWTITQDRLSGGGVDLIASGKISVGQINDSAHISAQHPSHLIWAGHQDALYAPFKVSKEGHIDARAGTIGGWILGANVIEGGYLRLESKGTVKAQDEQENDVALLGDLADVLPGKHGLWAIQGKVGGWSLDEYTLEGSSLSLDSRGSITAGSGNSSVIIDSLHAAYRLWVGHTSPNFAPFRVSRSGEVTALAGSIGGWALDDNTLQGDDIVFDASGKIKVGSGAESIHLDSKHPGYRMWAGSEQPSGASFALTKDGHVESVSATFGAGHYRITLDDDGLYSGTLGDPSSPFGIYIRQINDPNIPGNVLAHEGDAYFKGSVTVRQDSIVEGGVSTTSLRIQSGGRILLEGQGQAKIELRASGFGGPGGFYAFNTDGDQTVGIDAQTGNVVITGAINATGGTIKGNLTVADKGDIRIVGTPVGVTDKPGIYFFEPDPGIGILRLFDKGLQFSPDGGQSWHDAIRPIGMTADAIKDGTLRIDDSGTSDEQTRILVTRTQHDERITLNSILPTKLLYDPLEPGSEIVKSLDGQTVYTPNEDYIIDYLGGNLRRTDISTIPDGATVSIHYTHHRVEIDSQKGITIHDGSLEVRSSQTGTTLISGGHIHVQGLDVGVYQSDNFIANGNFSQISSDWGVARKTDGASVPGFPKFPAGEDYYGDWIKDRMGRIYRYGSAFWIPNKSDVTYDQDGNLTGYARVAFAPEDFLHQIYGYAEIELGGVTYQWGQIEQDVYPWYNHTNGDFIIPNERFLDVVGWMQFHWHATHSPHNTVTLEMDELVPRYVFIEPKQTEKFTPVWDNVFDEQNGLVYSDGWEFDDSDPAGSSGENVAYGCDVSSNAAIVPGTEGYAVDWHFVREAWATRTEGSGLHYLEVDLGEVQPINQIWVWHSVQTDRRYRNNKLEVSEDGVNWQTIYDSNVDGPWREGQGGKAHNFATKQIRYIRDWIDGYELLDEEGNIVGGPVEQNQWLEIQARHCGYMVTSTPGAWVEWTFTTHSRADLWVGYLQAPDHGDGYIEIDGVRVATIQQAIMVGDYGSHDHSHEPQGGGFMPMHGNDDHGHSHSRAYVDVSSQADFQMVPRKPHTIRVVFEDTPENYGKHFAISRIKLEDFQLEGPHHTSRVIVASANIQTSEPYGFYTGSVVPRNARSFTGRGRQILKGMWDAPSNFSPSSNCWLRYRLRVRSERAPGGNPHDHEHVMITGAVVEIGTKPTHFRRSSLDLTPSHFLQEWDPRFPETTGVRSGHIADGAVTSSKLALKAVTADHLADDFTIPEANLDLNFPTHQHTNKAVLDQIEGWGGSGTSFEIARADHTHSEYLKVTGGTISGNLTVTGTINNVNISQLQSSLTSHTGNTSNPHNVTAAQVGALVSIDGVSSPGGNVDLVAGTNISITPSTSSRTITIAHTGNHDDRYYTKTNLSTSGQAQVHWNNLTSVPSTFAPPVASASTLGGIKVGTGLAISNEVLSVVYSGSGSASSAARSDHHHDAVYAKLTGSTITGTTTFAATQDAIKLVPASNPNTQVNDEEVTLTQLAPQPLSRKPIHAGSEVVKSADGQTTYVRGEDYEIDYWKGTIARTVDSAIPSESKVKVSYLATRILFRITDPAQTENKLAFDSEGNILGNSITVSLTRTEEETGGQTSGDFSILGNLQVSGSSVLGTSASSVTSISGTLVVWDEPDANKLFEVTGSGNASLAGTLSVQELLVNGTSVSLQGHHHNDLYPTRTELAASGQVNIHWGNLTNVPTTAARWPNWSEVTSKPSSFAPSSHASTHASGGSDPITPAMIGAQPALGFTPVNKAGDTMTGALAAPLIRFTGSRPQASDPPSTYGEGLCVFDSETDAPYSWPLDGGAVISAKASDSWGRFGQLLLHNTGAMFRAKASSNDEWSPWRTIWDNYNHGSGSGLDADLLDGQQGSYYRNASNLNAGTLPAARFTDTSHGQRSGGNLHAAATASSAGFMSAADKTKLDSIAAGAEVNQNAFSQVSVPGQTSIQASAKTDTLSFSAGDYIQITTNAGQKRVTISAAHDHKQEYAHIKTAVERFGYGVVSGMKVGAKNPPDLVVEVAPGVAYLPSGQRLETITPVDLTVDTPHGTYSRIDVVYIANRFETNPQANFGIERGTASASPQEPTLPEGAIKLAALTVPPLAEAVVPSNISDKRQYVSVEYNKDEAIFRGRQTDSSSEGWRFDGQGRLRLQGGIATGGSNTYVNVSAKAAGWDDAATKRHTHIYNEVPAKDTSDASGKTYLLTYEPADDSFPGNAAGKKIMVYKNGLLRRPYKSGTSPAYDYTVQQNKIIFAEAPKAEDHILVFYETV